jgi:hypothetical protein
MYANTVSILSGSSSTFSLNIGSIWSYFYARGLHLLWFFIKWSTQLLLFFYILINCCILKRFLFAISDQKQTVWLLDEKAIYFFNEQHTQENIIRLIRKDFSGFLTKGKSCSVETNWIPPFVICCFFFTQVKVIANSSTSAGDLPSSLFQAFQWLFQIQLDKLYPMVFFDFP